MEKQVILLNGPSSSGKSTLAKCLQGLIRAKRRERYEIVSIDDFLTMTAQDALCEEDVYEISPDLCAAASASLETAAGVIVDHVITSRRIFDQLTDTLQDCRIWMIRVTCPPEVLREREAARGDRCPGSAEASAAHLFPQDGYDLAVDTHIMTEADCAERIYERCFHADMTCLPELTENMILWAKDKLGSREYAAWCLSFIEDALEKSNGIEIFGGDSAKESALLYADGMRPGRPERGAFVFYDCVCRGPDGPVNWGHCGISLGDGRIIHAWGVVRIDDYREIEDMTALSGDHPGYIGWVPVERVLKQKDPAAQEHRQANGARRDRHEVPAGAGT